MNGCMGQSKTVILSYTRFSFRLKTVFALICVFSQILRARVSSFQCCHARPCCLCSSRQLIARHSARARAPSPGWFSKVQGWGTIWSDLDCSLNCSASLLRYIQCTVYRWCAVEYKWVIIDFVLLEKIPHPPGAYELSVGYVINYMLSCVSFLTHTHTLTPQSF